MIRKFIFQLKICWIITTSDRWKLTRPVGRGVNFQRFQNNDYYTFLIVKLKPKKYKICNFHCISISRGMGVNSQRWNFTLCKKFYFIYRDFNVAITKWLTLNFNREWGVTFQLWNLTPYIMTHITYHNLKVQNGNIDYLSRQQWRRGQFSTLKVDPI